MPQTIQVKSKCSTCNGTGQQPIHSNGGYSYIDCKMCNTTGYVTDYEFVLDPGLQGINNKIKDLQDDMDVIKSQISDILEAVSE